MEERNGRQVTLGVIGSGMISDIYLTNMTQHFPVLRVKSICARHPEHAREKAEKYGILAVTKEEMLADPEIELVVILTPMETHFELIQEALLSGKHVYTEKTMAADLDQARRLAALARERGLLLGSAPDTFLGEAYQTGRRAIEEGLIGEITSFSITCNRCYDLLLCFFPIIRVPGNGILYDYLVYYITALVSLLGPVREVVGITANPFPERVNPISRTGERREIIKNMNETVADAILTLESGISGTVHVNGESSAGDMASVAIFGRRGILYLTDANQFRGEVKFVPLRNDPGSQMKVTILKPTARSLENARGIGPADLAEAILEGRKCRPDAGMALHVMEVLTAIRDSHGKMVKIQSTCEKPEMLPLQDPGIRRFAHAAFQLRRGDEMMHFYRDLLGMTEVFDLTFKDDLSMLRESRPEIFTEDLSCMERARLKELQRRAKEGETWLLYLRLQQGQFLEFFFDDGTERRMIENRRDFYGCVGLTLETGDLGKVRAVLSRYGAEGSWELLLSGDAQSAFTARDPDGNVVRFIERESESKAGQAPDAKGSGDGKAYALKSITLQVQDSINMRRFYTDGLGLKPVRSLTVDDLLDALERDQGSDKGQAQELRLNLDCPWIDCLEVGPGETIELVYMLTGKKEEDRHLEETIGFQHFCLEVEDIRKAYDAVIANGIIPDTEITLGADHTWQFWMTDPDGNRLEMHQYTEASMQLDGQG